MKDNAKCAGVGCNLRDMCVRFVRPAVDRQEWIEPTWQSVWNFADIAEFMRCVDIVPILPEPVDPHGGAPEEGDQC